MNLTSLFTRGRAAADPFAAPDAPAASQPELQPVKTQPVKVQPVDRPAIVEARAFEPIPPQAPLKPLKQSKRRRSWFGWLFGNKRGSEPTRLVQGELLLQKVRPVRNDFRDEPPTTGKAKAQVLWETPRQDAPRDDQDHAWNRLRNRRVDSLTVKTD